MKLFPIRQFFLHRLVSTLVVEWIEIPIAMNPPRLLIVSTLVVEWIEIDERMYINQWFSRLHPRGGVD